MRTYPNNSLINVDVESQGDRIAFIRGALAMYAWAHGNEAPPYPHADTLTGNEQVILAALGDALDIASRDVGNEHTDRVEHCLGTVREAVRIAMRDAAGAGML